MGIWLFYLLALVPVAVGGILWMRNREITWAEWLGGSAIGFALAAIFQFVSIWGMTSDIETWSGQISRVTHCPAWTEEYTETHTRTVSDGNGKSHTETYTTTEYEHHPEHWVATKNFGTYVNASDISVSFFNEAAGNFGGKIGPDGSQPTGHGGFCISGDRGQYSAYDQTGYVYPVTCERHFENRIKAAPTLFSFTAVPTNIAVYTWPNNPDWLHSSRLLGTAPATIDPLEFDRMNARLGPSKRVNVIMVGFGNKDMSYAEWQRAKWIGGKKNDLVLCYGGLNAGKPSWSRVFGWSDSEICKRKLESILIDNPATTATLPLIEKEIRAEYIIKNWKAFDYITVEPPTWSYWVFVIVLTAAQVFFYLWAANNEFRRGSDYGDLGARDRWGYPRYVNSRFGNHFL